MSVALRSLIPLTVVLLAACSRPAEPQAPPGAAPAAPQAAAAPPEPVASPPPAMDLDIDAAARAAYAEFWNALLDHCDRAYAGRVEDAEPADLPWHGETLVMHVRRCTPAQIDIAISVGENRSQTWQLIRTAQGLSMRHDLRFPDGTATALSGWRGDAQADADPKRLRFVPDAAARALFEDHSREDLLESEWTLELDPERGLSYAIQTAKQRYRIVFSFDARLPPPDEHWGDAPAA